MREVGIWFALSCKRYLKKPSFFVILLVLPVLTFWVQGVEKEERQEVRIAVYGETGEGLERELVDSLIDEEKNSTRALFRFYECGSEEQVKEEVASRRAECGYIFPENLREKLDEKQYRRSIRVYAAPSTVLDALSTEIVFAALMELYDREIFVDYVLEAQELILLSTDQGSKTEAELEELAKTLYDKWMGNGSTFRFEYGYGSQRGPRPDTPATSNVFPVRGIVAVYLFLVGLYSAVMVSNDEEKGLFLPLSYGRRRLCSMTVLGAPVWLAALSCLAALKTGGSVQETGREVLIMGAYGVAVCFFSYGVRLICQKPWIIGCLIPFLLVGSMIFTPVFFDIKQFIPALGWVETLFLPSYYLRAF